METRWLTTKEKATEEHVSEKTILRRARKHLYPAARQVPSPRGKWLFPPNDEMAAPRRGLTDQEILIEEERKQAVLKHHKSLCDVVGRWKSEVWLPPPWRWDIANLQHVFYVDTRKLAKGEAATGYKLPSDLVNSAESKENSRGHFRHSEQGQVQWEISKDGEIILKLPVEGDDSWVQLKAHTQDSPAWALFVKWKEDGGTYIRLCSSLLSEIEQNARRATGAKSPLFSWVIYHNAFCRRATELRCERCGKINPKDSRFCQGCGLLLGWLRLIRGDYEWATKHTEFSPVHIHGWGNVEDNVQTGRFEGMKRAHVELMSKYAGCDLVDTILEAEKTVREVETKLIHELESLSKDRVYPGQCSGCTPSDQS